MATTITQCSFAHPSLKSNTSGHGNGGVRLRRNGELTGYVLAVQQFLVADVFRVNLDRNACYHPSAKPHIPWSYFCI